MSTAQISLSRISKVFSMGDVQVGALDGVSLTICSGGFVAIMGSSCHQPLLPMSCNLRVVMDMLGMSSAIESIVSRAAMPSKPSMTAQQM